MAYINPSTPDGNDDRLWKHHVDIEHERIMTGNDRLDSLDRAIRLGKRPSPRAIPAGWSPIPGQSRSGALDPQSRARFERREADGEIELLRSGTAWPYAWRKVTDNENEEDES